MGNVHLVTGHAGTEHVKAEDQGAFNAALLGAGQFVFEKGNKLSATIVSNNLVRVLDGDICMQGRYIRLAANSYVDLTIENGNQGYLRNDLIVARYTKNGTTGVEECSLVVIKGTPAENSPADPAYTEGDITEGYATLNDMPLYRVTLNGLNITQAEQLFEFGGVAKGPSLDTTLSVEGAAADAKAVGDAISSLKADIGDIGDALDALNGEVV